MYMSNKYLSKEELDVARGIDNRLRQPILFSRMSGTEREQLNQVKIDLFRNSLIRHLVSIINTGVYNGTHKGT